MNKSIKSIPASYLKLRNFMKKIREKEKESLIKMAERIGYSQSYLSCIERGLRPVPANFIKKISETYNLDEEKRMRLNEIVSETDNTVSFDLRSMTGPQKILTVIFKEKISKLNGETIEKIRRILEK